MGCMRGKRYRAQKFSMLMYVLYKVVCRDSIKSCTSNILGIKDLDHKVQYGSIHVNPLNPRSLG